MLIRQTTKNGLVVYLSPLLRKVGVPHAFSTRGGGVSPGPFASLNLGISIEGTARDSIENVEENYHRFKQAIDCGSRERNWVTQVHGAEVCEPKRDEAFENGVRADALICADPARLVSVKYADCVPVLLCSADGRVVAAVHAGWRGVIAGIVPQTARQLAQRAPAESLRAAIGPCISQRYFEVGLEVLVEFRAHFGEAAPIQPAALGKGHVDLRRAIVLQLIRQGLRENQIDTTDRCTFEHEDEFFSHRRDRGVTGRMAAMIGPRGENP